MRVFTILLLFAIFLNFTTHDFEGGYLSEKENKEGYYFWTDTKEFSWFKFQNNFKEFGRGTFEQTSDSITLNFGPARKQFDIKEGKEFVERGNESVEIAFTDADGKPIEGLEIKLEKLGLRAITDKNGVATLDTKGTKIDKDEIDFRTEKYRTYQQTVYLKRQRYNFIVVADKGRKYKENQTEKLKFAIKGKEIEISHGKNKNYFKPVTRNRFMDLYHGFKK
jgi:hypothetical protein